MTEQGQNGVEGSGGPNRDDVPAVRLLDDKPEDQDLTGGGHQRVADAIARLIEREKGGKAIALEGSWGSGKSSVVRMLEKAFAEFGEEAKKTNKKKDRGPEDRTNHDEDLPTDYLVYVFDAWKHEGDPLRVAFLRGLAGWLWKPSTGSDRKGWLTDGEFRRWKRSIDKLAGGESTTETEDSVQIETPEIAALSALLLIPTAIAIAVAYLTASQPSDLLYWLGTGALLLLLLIPALAIIAKWSNPKAVARIFEVMITRQPKRHTVQLHRSGEVSSLDFEREFRKLLEQVLEEHHTRRLVVVVDNLDRLSAEDAQAVWTTMRVFLEMSMRASPWLSRFWLMVPYDRTALSSLWEHHAPSSVVRVTDGHGNAGHARLEVMSPDSDATNTPHHNRPTSFLDKTFAVRHDVPPLLLSNWETALGGYLDTALKRLATTEAKAAVARLSRRFAFGQKHPPTPRHLKLFVNDIGALVRQHGTRLQGVADETEPDEVVFSLESLAAYAILRREPMSPEDIREDLRTGAHRINSILPAGWLTTQEPSPLTPRDQALACLVFNTHKPREAMELLLVQPLAAAIRSGDIEALDNLASIPAAVRVVGEEQDRVASAIQPNGIVELESILATLETVYDQSGLLPARLISRFARAMYAPDRSLTEATDLPELVRRFVKLTPDEDVLAWLAAAMTTSSLTATGRFSGEDLAKARGILHTADTGPAVSRGRARDIPIPKGPQRAARFLSQLWRQAQTTIALWDRLDAERDAPLLNQILPENDYASWSEDSFAALRVLVHCDSALVDWDVAGSRLASRLQAHPSEAGILNMSSTRFLRGDGVITPVASDLMAAKALDRISTFSKHLDALYKGATLDDLLVAAVGKQNWTLAASLLIEIGSRRNLVEVSGEATPAATSRPHMNDILNKPAEFKALVQAIANTDRKGVPAFVQRRITKHDGELLLHVIFQAMDDDAVAHCLPVDWILSQWADIEAVDEGNGIIESRILQVHEYAEGDRNRSLSNAIAEGGVKDHQLGLIQSIAERDNLNPVLKNAIHKRMASLDREQWTSELLKSQPLYKLLETLPPEDRPTLDAPFHMAVESIAEQLISEPNTIRPISADEKAMIFSVLPKHLGYTLRDNLRFIASDAPKDERARLYEVFGPEIAEAMLEDPRERDGPDILLPIFIGSEGSDPAWLPQFIKDERSPRVVARSDKTKQVFLIEAIRKRMASEGEAGGLFTSFLQRCDRAGLVPHEDPKEADDTPPA